MFAEGSKHTHFMYLTNVLNFLKYKAFLQWFNSSHFFDSESCVETERGLFSQCLQKLVTGGIAKPYLTSYMGGKVKVTLNDGRCKVDEQDMFYYFQTSRKPSECGIQKQVSDSKPFEKSFYILTTTKIRCLSVSQLFIKIHIFVCKIKVLIWSLKITG